MGYVSIMIGAIRMIIPPSRTKKADRIDGQPFQYLSEELFFCRFHQAVNVCNVVIVL